MGKTGKTVSVDQNYDLRAALGEHAMVAISDPRGTITYVNDRFCAMSKYSRKELLGKNQRLIHRGLHTRQFTGNIWKLPGGEKSWKGEITSKAKDGSLYRADTTIVPFFNAEKKPRQCVTIGVEIKAPSRAPGLTLGEDFPALIWRANMEAKSDYFNRPWLEFTGRRLKQEKGDGWAGAVHPKDLQGCLDHFLKAFQSRQPFKMEYRLRNAAGEYRWILDCGRPVNDPAGNFAGYIGSCFDISTIKSSPDGLLHERLSPRENQVMLLLPSGKSLKEIAGELGITVQTVSTHRSRILKKLRLRTTPELIRYVFVYGLVE